MERGEYRGEWGRRNVPPASVKKGKASSLDIAPLTILNSGTFTTSEVAADCGSAAHAVAAQSLR